jgi:hypothetical protein
MATWFGKYNKNGYAFKNNGLGSSSDHLKYKKETEVFKSVALNAQEYSDEELFNTSQSNVKINETYEVTYTNDYQMLYTLKKGQSHIHYDCNESTYFIDNKTMVFDPNKCYPQTYSTTYGIDNADCSNNYQGMKLVDIDGNPINSTVTKNTVYAEIKSGQVSNIIANDVEKERLDTHIYLYMFPEDC